MLSGEGGGQGLFASKMPRRWHHHSYTSVNVRQRRRDARNQSSVFFFLPLACPHHHLRSIISASWSVMGCCGGRLSGRIVMFWQRTYVCMYVLRTHRGEDRGDGIGKWRPLYPCPGFAKSEMSFFTRSLPSLSPCGCTYICMYICMHILGTRYVCLHCKHIVCIYIYICTHVYTYVFMYSWLGIKATCRTPISRHRNCT